MKRYIRPNWKKSNLNISATLAEYLGAPNTNSTLPLLKKELDKNYKNVVFICLDGLGIHPIKKNLDKNSLLRKNIKQVLTSTFPSTTTNATTALTCNKLPLEHGWLGWSLHFDQIQRNLDIYLHKDSQTGEAVDYDYPIYDNGDCYFDHATKEIEVTPVMPIYVKTKSENKKIAITNEFELCSAIKSVCEREGKQFVYAYLNEPDYTMHDFGVTSSEAKEKIESIHREIEKLYNQVEDTLIIISADHGHIDIEGHIDFYKDEEMNALLKCPAYLDGRTPAFIVKDSKHKEFEKKFKKKYGKDFKLRKSADLIKKGYFGDRGIYGYLLGDYIGIGTFTHKQFLNNDKTPHFKGHHTSLTEEMLVPLIMLAKKEKEK